MANYFKTAAVEVGSPRRAWPNADSTITAHGHGTAAAQMPHRT